MALRREDLENKILELDIPMDENVKWDNTKLIKKLGEHYMPENASWGTRFMNSIETVMLCKHMKDEAKNFKVSPLESEDYVSEFKCNGCRVIIVFDPVQGFEFFSRRESVTNFLNANFTPKILFIKDGIVTKPEDYKGKFNVRFILDGEITVDGDGSMEFEGTHHDTVEDFLQAVLGSLPERAKSFQLKGKSLKFNIFDCLYYEKNPVGNPPLYSFDFSSDKELTKDEIEWVESHYANYLTSAGFTLGKRIPKLLYRYLYDLRKSPRHDIRRLPFYKRRQVRSLLVNYLQKAHLPFVEVSGEDKFKTEYLAEVLGNQDEGCFDWQTQVNMADGTMKRISQIKAGDLVLSYNTQTSMVEPKPVKNVFYNGKKPVQQWVSVSHGVLQGCSIPSKQNQFRRIKCTRNHKYFAGDSYTMIDDLNYCYEYNYVLDNYRKQALIGWLLSDACITKDNQIILSQKNDTLYWNYTKHMFECFTKSVDKVRVSGKGSLIGYINILKQYTHDWVIKSEDYSYLINQMDDISLAYFIMGDGGARSNSLTLYTESYSLDEINKIINKISSIVGKPLKYSLSKDKRVSTYGYSIRFSKSSTDEIYNKVSSYIHPSMLYKFGTRDVSQVTFIEPPEPIKDICKVPIFKTPLISYSQYSDDSIIGAWDLEVEDNHNYFVENVLVHNCILKNLDAPYISALKSSRSHKACMKVKQSVKELMNGANKYEDFDVFIIGANPPKSDRIKDMIGSLKCGIYLIDETGETVLHEIANVSGIPHEWKKALAVVNPNTQKIELNSEYLNKVIAIDGMALSHSSLRFQHAVLKEKQGLVFKDKNSTDCVWDKEELEKMVIVRGNK